jgi:hypothetical protein
LEWKAMGAPSGDQVGLSSEKSLEVSRVCLEEGPASMVYISQFPSRKDWKAMRATVDDQDGAESIAALNVTRVGSDPSAFIV